MQTNIGVFDLATKHRQRLISTRMPDNPLAVTPIREGPVKQGFTFDNRVFFSYQEVLCYQYLKSIGISGKKMHMEFRVGRNHFDFFPLKRVFWEHHPILRVTGKDLEEYANSRREILDSQGYSHIPLVVSDQMFVDVDDVGRLMSSVGVDFRTGKVPDDSIIYLVEPQNDEILYKLLSEPFYF